MTGNKLTKEELIVKMRCPFCDGQGCLDWILREGYEKDKDDPDAKAYFIRCKSCASNGGWSKSPPGAFRLWNMRQQKPTVTLAEIRELSARLRDTSRQSLYETKLRRWLESKGMEVVE